MANLITYSRIILSLIMLRYPACAPPVYCCYLFAGFSDMIDGTIARRCGTVSDFGAGLDTIADLIFVIVSAYKFLPILNLPIIVWIWTGVIAVIKIINIISGYVMKKRFVSVHTIANKLTGVLLFVFPLSAAMMDIRYSATVVCVAATFAAIHEGHVIRTIQ